MEGILWWHWVSFGLILIGAELIVPSFTIIWFGLGACITGLFLLVVPAAKLSTQLFLWTCLSALLTFLWFRLLKPRMVDRTKAGMSREAIAGEVGMVVKANPTKLDKGRIRFTIPLLGAEEWDFFSEDLLRPGDYARVTGIEGHVLQVEIQQQSVGR